jgi:hypothetical protein
MKTNLKLIKKYDLHVEDVLCFNPNIFHIKNKCALLYEEIDECSESYPITIHYYEASVLIVNLE